MKNVAIIVYQLTGGGAERIAGLLSKYLSVRYNVFLFLCRCDTITYDYGGTIVDIYDAGRTAEQGLKAAKRKYQIDCSISFLEECNLSNIRTRIGESIIISSRCSRGEDIDYPQSISGKIKKWYGEADRIVSCAYGEAYDLSHNFGVDATLITPIYNFIDKDKIRNNSVLPVRDGVLNFIGNSRVILNVGRLHKQKNQRKLLVQFAKLLKEDYDVKLIILGAGDQEVELKTIAEQLGIRDKVLFETYCKNPFPYYKLADVMALSTDYEGLPNVILEAMTLGLPVVSTDCLSGPLELLKGCRDYSVRIQEVEICERGILVPKKESDSLGTTSYLADGIKLLLDNREISEKIATAQKEYMGKYDNDKILEAWIEVIENTKPKTMKSKESFTELEKETKIIIYGAGTFGQRIMKLIRDRNQAYDLLCYAVTAKVDNPDMIDGIAVYPIVELLKYRKDALVVIGVSTQFEHEIKEVLEQYGFRYIFHDLALL